MNLPFLVSSEPEKNLKTYIMGLIFISLISMTSIGLWALYKTHVENIQAEVIKTISSVKQFYAYKINQDAKQLSSLLELIVNDADLLTQLADKNRQGLLSKYKSLFLKLKNKYQITHFYFSDNQRVNILRVHNPQRYGDVINRDTTLKAEVNKSIYHGVELGKFGLITLRVVIPIYQETKLIGFVELGKEVEHIINDVKSIIPVDIMISLYKKYLDQSTWEEGMHQMKREADWGRFSTTILVASTFDKIDRAIEILSLQSLKHFHFDEHSETLDEYEIDSNRLLFQLPIIESSGTEIGDLIVYLDYQSIYLSLKHKINRLLIMGIVIVIILSLIIYWLLHKTQLSIHKLREQEKVITEEIKLFSKVYENSLNEIYIFDGQDYHFINVNQAARINLGYTMDELRLLNAIDIKPEVSGEEFNELILPLTKDEVGKIEFSTIHQRKNGTRYPVEVHLQKMGESTTYYVAITLDITERKLAEEKLLNYKNDLEEQVQHRTIELEYSKNEAIKANQAKSDFLANMTHELRTPMHGILSFAQMGLKRVETITPEKNKEYLTHIKTSADRLMNLLNDLLDISKLEEGTLSMSFKHNSLKTITQSCIATQQELLDKSNLKVVFVSNTESIGEGVFDGKEIAHVIVNLLSNAVKFSPEHTQIDICINECEIDSNDNSLPAIFFSIRDYGKGIVPGEEKLVFDKFEQGSDITLGTTKGTGLGLPISKEIIELHKGNIWAENHNKGGAVFSFIIPREQINQE